MKKIGIISELNFNNSNYGNRLQAYALNKYLNENFDCEAESIVLKGSYDVNKQTSKVFFTKLKKIKKLPAKLKKRLNSNKYNYSERIKECNEFTKKTTKLCKEPMDFKALEESEYDCFITGSDVVWAQVRGGVHRIRFLDFNTPKKCKRIAYAPSFGRDWIPKENISTIKEILSTYDAVSTREKSSVSMLNNIGVMDVEHVCDPTLLIEKEKWEEIEKKVNINEKFIFVYLLGKDAKQRKEIERTAKDLDLKIVSIPHANQEYNKVDNEFGDYKIDNCSPEEWIWLIHNAELIVTDSFHGVVFSTIFKKKFFVLKRFYEENINNRMIDFLNTIEQSDKMVENCNEDLLSEKKWDYDKINNNLNDYIEKSKKYLQKNLK